MILLNLCFFKNGNFISKIHVVVFVYLVFSVREFDLTNRDNAIPSCKQQVNLCAWTSFVFICRYEPGILFCKDSRNAKLLLYLANMAFANLFEC